MSQKQAPGRFENRVAVVFGGGTVGRRGAGIGNGQAAAIAYAREGARVVVADIGGDAAMETVEKITAEGGEAKPVTCNVAMPAEVEAAIDVATSAWGRLDILHNNVGVAPMDDALTVSDEEILHAFNVNVVGIVRACRKALPIMIRQGCGVITNISAIGGMRFYDQLLSYSVSKAALDCLTRFIASKHFGNGVRCNAIVPGIIETPLAVAGYSELMGSEAAGRELLQSMSPARKTGSPWDVASAAVFLASDEAAYINGVLLPVDGGVINLAPGGAVKE